MLYLYPFLFFISSGLLIYSILSLFSKKRAIERLGKYFEGRKEEEIIKRETKINIKPRKLLNSLGSKISNIDYLKRYIEKTQFEIIKAGIPLKGEELIAIQILLCVLLFLFTINIFNSMVIAIMFSILGLLIPKQIIKLRKNKRYKMFNEQLGDAIVLISNSLKAGHSFLQAIDSAAREMPEPINKEFGKVLKEMRLGIPTEQALESLINRVESDDLELMVTAVLIQRQVGGNLSEILDTISNTIRERVKLKGEIKTLTAQGRLSGIIVSLLPLALGGALFFINPEYLNGLFETKVGIAILIVAILNQLIGIILINKIVKIEV
ncbi:MAG: type II secretion system F family protein [Firmicutes bacterium]|nr:type II secretion system F family protein [Bacillota bacterium]